MGKQKGDAHAAFAFAPVCMAAMQEKAKEGRRDGRGETRVGATSKNREERAHQPVLAREECEEVMRGATGGQRRGRNECRTRGRPIADLDPHLGPF